MNGLCVLPSETPVHIELRTAARDFHDAKDTAPSVPMWSRWINYCFLLIVDLLLSYSFSLNSALYTICSLTGECGNHIAPLFSKYISTMYG